MRLWCVLGWHRFDLLVRQWNTATRTGRLATQCRHCEQESPGVPVHSEGVSTSHVPPKLAETPSARQRRLT